MPGDMYCRATMSQIRIVQVSKIDEADRGFNFPWKAPVLPRRKKALLAFEMLILTESFAERSLRHWTPKHRADFEVVI